MRKETASFFSCSYCYSFTLSIEIPNSIRDKILKIMKTDFNTGKVNPTTQAHFYTFYKFIIDVVELLI